jgi:hypothetical protein
MLRTRPEPGHVSAQGQPSPTVNQQVKTMRHRLQPSRDPSQESPPCTPGTPAAPRRSSRSRAPRRAQSPAQARDHIGGDVRGVGRMGATSTLLLSVTMRVSLRAAWHAPIADYERYRSCVGSGHAGAPIAPFCMRGSLHRNPHRGMSGRLVALAAPSHPSPLGRACRLDGGRRIRSCTRRLASPSR